MRVVKTFRSNMSFIGEIHQVINDHNVPKKKIIGHDDYDTIIKYAKDLLKTDYFKNNWNGSDMRFNAALDISIQTVNNSEYQNRIDASTYDWLLSRLVGKNGKNGRYFYFEKNEGGKVKTSSLIVASASSVVSLLDNLNKAIHSNNVEQFKSSIRSISTDKSIGSLAGDIAKHFLSMTDENIEDFLANSSKIKEIESSIKKMKTDSEKEDNTLDKDTTDLANVITAAKKKGKKPEFLKKKGKKPEFIKKKGKKPEKKPAKKPAKKHKKKASIDINNFDLDW